MRIEEKFHQLHLCFDAANNLYACISMKKLLVKLGHHTRCYSHRGHTPAELGLPKPIVDNVLQEVSYDNNYVDPLAKIGPMLRTKLYLPATISSKSSRNGPCPCGSRKFKNCCGK